MDGEAVASVPSQDGPSDADMAGYEVSTSDIPQAARAESAPPEGEQPKVDKSEPAKTETPKPWFAWSQDGGMTVRAGRGVTIGEDGTVSFDPETVRRLANKRVGQAREEERQRYERQLAVERERLKAEIEATAAKPQPSDTPKPKLEDYESAEAWEDAVYEWRQARQAALTTQATRPADGTAQAPAASLEPPARKDFASDEAYGAAVEQYEHRQIALASHGIYEAGLQRFEDFEAVAGPLEVSNELMRVVAESDLAPEILYHLGSNAEARDAIDGLEGRDLQRAIFVLENTLKTGANGAPSVTSTRSPATEAPVKPVDRMIVPVKPAARPTTDLVTMAASEDTGAYFARLDEELR